MIVMRFSDNPRMHLVKGENLIRRLYGDVRPPKINLMTKDGDTILIWSRDVVDT